MDGQNGHHYVKRCNANEAGSKSKSDYLCSARSVVSNAAASAIIRKRTGPILKLMALGSLIML